MPPHTPAGTSPLAGEDGRGGARRPGLTRKLRANPTAAEVRLWRLLHTFRTGGFHFRKQVLIGSYVVDFACLHAGLVIEVDGDTHGTARVGVNDQTRDDYLGGRGFSVLRVSNQDVLRNPEGVHRVIEDILASRSPRERGSAPPSPSLPARGRVPAGGRGNQPNITSLSDTLPLAGRDGEGGDPGANPNEGRTG